MSEDDLQASICAALSGGPLTLGGLMVRMYGRDYMGYSCSAVALALESMMMSEQVLIGLSQDSEMLFSLAAVPDDGPDDGIPEFLKKHKS